MVALATLLAWLLESYWPAPVRKLLSLVATYAAGEYSAGVAQGTPHCCAAAWPAASRRSATSVELPPIARAARRRG